MECLIYILMTIELRQIGHPPDRGILFLVILPIPVVVSIQRGDRACF
jgi:hypothetical protein